MPRPSSPCPLRPGLGALPAARAAESRGRGIGDELRRVFDPLLFCTPAFLGPAATGMPRVPLASFIG